MQLFRTDREEFRAAAVEDLFGFDIGLDNALNKQYGLPLGGAYIGQGSTMSLSSSTTWSGTTAPVYGVAVPGMGRSLYAGVNVSF